MMKTKTFLFAGLAAVVVALASCKEANLFNEEDYKEFVTNAFPVQNIDPQHDWSTTYEFPFRIGIGYEGTYTLKFYSGNPETVSSRLLNSCQVEGNMTHDIRVVAPSVSNKMFVSLVDDKGQRRTKEVIVSSGINDVIFSESTSADDIISDASSSMDIPQTYTFCFEENFPQPGDYDFNDVVMGVTIAKSIENGTRHISIGVKVRAVGSGSRLASAMRLSGVSAKEVEGTAYERSGSGCYFFPQYGDQDMLPKFGDSNEFLTMRNSTDLVIPVFNDAHYFISGGATVAALPERNYYNTVTDEEDLRGVAVSAKTQTFKFAVNDATLFNNFSVSDIDLFILEEYNGGVFEVHTMPFKTVEVINEWAAIKADGTSPYGTNYPWALLIPGEFKYPIEGLSIGKAKGNVIGGAYLGFSSWAQNRTSNRDWYNKPQDSEVVYP
ncbi:MAG: LruC domain-containing protein [Prevotella sp.]